MPAKSTKVHLGDATIGILCRSGYTSSPNTTHVWDEVTCTTCQAMKVPAREVRAEALLAWLTSRVGPNEEQRTKREAWQAKWEHQRQTQVSTEAYTLYALQHDILEACPGDQATIEPREERSIHAHSGSVSVLKLQAGASKTSAVVTVQPTYRDDADTVCTIAWEATVTDIWTDSHGEVQETRSPLTEQSVPVEQVVEHWKQGMQAARDRYREEQLAMSEEAED